MTVSAPADHAHQLASGYDGLAMLEMLLASAPSSEPKTSEMLESEDDDGSRNHQELCYTVDMSRECRGRKSMRLFAAWRHHANGIILAIFVLSSVPIAAVPEALYAFSQQENDPSIQITKRRCAERDVFPIFVESHCEEVPNASFAVKDPRDIHLETVSAGERYAPDESYFGGPSFWTITDVSPDASMQGVQVISCLAYEPGSEWHSSSKRLSYIDASRGVLLDWTFVTTGVPHSTYRPSVDCIWLELPDMSTMPATLSLQVYTSSVPYLNWTEPTGVELPDLPRGESGDDLEAQMVMTNTTTGQVYPFAADDYRQVLVPEGTYSLVETANGLAEYFTMFAGQTTLVEVGLSAPGASTGSSGTDVVTGIFAAGALYCEGTGGCVPLDGVTIHYESMDGSISGSCITEIYQTPNGAGAWCDYPVIEGMPTVLTLDESTLPPGTVVTSENPQTYLVPENPGGPLGPVFFMVEPS